MPDAPDGLNDNHRRRLAASLTEIENLMSQIEQAATATSVSAFSQLAPDLSPTQRQVIGDYLRRLREIISSAVPLVGSHAETRKVAASWSIQTALEFIDIGVGELSPSSLRGYGALGPEGIATIESLQTELRRPVLQVRAYLQQDLGRDPAARLARLQLSPVDFALLRTLERIIRERGMVDLRPSLEALLQQLESGELEIAVFGRVSSGKSSLLNAVLGMDLLPIGVTPVTAVPTRIRWGDKLRAQISFAEKPAEKVELPRLAEFVSEAGNPDNAKRVVRALIEAPLPRLREGVVFVDTPGIGSLATGGERQTRSYLPRCDLGIVLVDCGSGMTPADLELIRVLYDSGIPGLIALSKADRLSEPDRLRMKRHTEEELRRALSLELEAHLVSSDASAVGLAQGWFERELAPRLARARELRDESARRKLAHLRDAASAILRVQLSRERPRESDALKKLANEAQLTLQETEARARDLPGVSDLASEHIVHQAARALVDGEANDARAAVLAASHELLERERREAQQRLLDTRDRLRAILERMGKLASAQMQAGELQLDLLEVPIVEPRLAAVELKRASRPLRVLALRSMERKLRAHFFEPMGQAFREQVQALRTWSSRQVAHLDAGFSAQALPLLARGTGELRPDKQGLEADLRALGQASGQASHA